MSIYDAALARLEERRMDVLVTCAFGEFLHAVMGAPVGAEISRAAVGRARRIDQIKARLLAREERERDMSSGVWEVSRDEGRECEAQDEDGIPCRWEGDVEVSYDREDYSVWWRCPACETEHIEAWPGE